MPRIILLSVSALFFTLPALAQQNAEPCGPATDLTEDFSKNVDAGSRCFELRMYTAEPALEGEGGIDNLHQRFRETASTARRPRIRTLHCFRKTKFSKNKRKYRALPYISHTNDR